SILKTLSYVIQHGEHFFNVMGIANNNDFNDYVPVFTESMKNFRELKDAAKLNRKPERIRLKTISSNATLEQTLKSLKVPENRWEEVSLLNGMELSNKVSKGDLIKVLER